MANFCPKLLIFWYFVDSSELALSDGSSVRDTDFTNSTLIIRKRFFADEARLLGVSDMSERVSERGSETVSE